MLYKNKYILNNQLKLLSEMKIIHSTLKIQIISSISIISVYLTYNVTSIHINRQSPHINSFRYTGQ